MASVPASVERIKGNPLELLDRDRALDPATTVALFMQRAENRDGSELLISIQSRPGFKFVPVSNSRSSHHVKNPVARK
jgi:hypothetical protein